MDQFPTEKQHKKRYIFLVVGILVVAAVVAAYVYARKPAMGVIKPGAKETISPIDQAAASVPKTFSGTYVSFAYGSTYAMRSHDTGTDMSGVILENAYFVETAEISTVSKKISLTVRSLPSGNLDDDPDYRMRTMSPKRYKKGVFSKNGVEGAVFTPADQGSFEKSFFVRHEGLLAIIVMTAPSSSDPDLEKEADAVAGSLSWVPR